MTRRANDEKRPAQLGHRDSRSDCRHLHGLMTSTATSRHTGFVHRHAPSCEASSIVDLLCVMKMNCTRLDISARCRRSDRRCAHPAGRPPHRGCRGGGLRSKIEHERHRRQRLLTAGKLWMVLFFLPGGRAMTATRPSEYPRPPARGSMSPPKGGETSPSCRVDAREGLPKRVRVSLSMRRMA